MLLGIDLGTTFCPSAMLGPAGVPVLPPDWRDGKSFHTPSVVHVGPQGALVGGRNFDEIIIDAVRSQFRAQHGTVPPPAPDSDPRLRQFATAAKLELSRPGQSVVRKPISLAGKSLEIVLTRSQFEAASRL
jgi:molecular chaperone DnaK (HSP70)